MLDLVQLQAAVVATRRQFDLIRKKYPELKASLVLSLPGGQTEIDSPPTEILNKFPAMLIDDSTKTSALNLLERLETTAKLLPEAARLKQQLEQLIPQLKCDDQCQVEIRFQDIKYELIWKLQADDLVDRSLTPQTKASICIVLGTLAQFARIPTKTL